MNPRVEKIGGWGKQRSSSNSDGKIDGDPWARRVMHTDNVKKYGCRGHSPHFVRRGITRGEKKNKGSANIRKLLSWGEKDSALLRECFVQRLKKTKANLARSNL